MPNLITYLGSEDDFFHNNNKCIEILYLKGVAKVFPVGNNIKVGKDFLISISSSLPIE